MGNPSRVAASFRWCYAVDITGVHAALRAQTLRSTRYFAKAELPTTVTIERLSVKDNLRFVVVAGAMLLVSSKESLLRAALTQLVASGVGEQKVKATPLSAARCQSFFSDGLTSGVGPTSIFREPTAQHGPLPLPPPPPRGAVLNAKILNSCIWGSR